MMDGHRYIFKSSDQWQSALRMRLPSQPMLKADQGQLLRTLTEAPLSFVAKDRDSFAWIGSDGILKREDGWSGPVLGSTARLAWSGRYIWALAGETLFLIEAATLQPLDTFTQQGAIDLAADGTGGLWVLTNAALLHLNACGRLLSTQPLANPIDRIAAIAKAVYLLGNGGKEITVQRPDGTILRIALDQIEGQSGAFEADGLVSGGDIALLTGHSGAVPGFLGFDAAGDLLFRGEWKTDDLLFRGEWKRNEPLFVILLGNALVAVAAEDKKWTVRLFDGAAADGGELVLTPLLESDTLEGAWRNIKIRAELPANATLSINWAATGDEALAALAQKLLDDNSLSHDERVRKLSSILPLSDTPITYAGQSEAPPIAVEAFDAPLSEVQGNYLLLAVTIRSNEGALQPKIVSLDIAHDVASLMDYLPAVYRTQTGDGDGTLHRLVEVLAATFGSFDTEIGKLGDRLDPERVEAGNLAWLARLLGLPFDDALDVRSRRALLHAAPDIIAGRGTPAGVRALLTAVLGERPYRIIDRTEQFIPISLGGGNIAGTRLPGFLAGSPTRLPKLNAWLTLGKTPLNPPALRDCLVSRGSELLVTVPVTGVELQRLGAGLRQMIEALIPAGVRLNLRWNVSGGASGGTVLGVVEEWPLMTLDAGLPPGSARLGGSCEPRLRDGGVAMDHRLT